MRDVKTNYNFCNLSPILGPVIKYTMLTKLKIIHIILNLRLVSIFTVVGRQAENSTSWQPGNLVAGKVAIFVGNLRGKMKTVRREDKGRKKREG